MSYDYFAFCSAIQFMRCHIGEFLAGHEDALVALCAGKGECEYPDRACRMGKAFLTLRRCRQKYDRIRDSCSGKWFPSSGFPSAVTSRPPPVTCNEGKQNRVGSFFVPCNKIQRPPPTAEVSGLAEKALSDQPFRRFFNTVQTLPDTDSFQHPLFFIAHIDLIVGHVFVRSKSDFCTLRLCSLAR